MKFFPLYPLPFTLLDLIFPPKCLICRNPNKNLICQTCHSKIAFINSTNKNIILIAKYDGIIKTAIKRLKFHKKKKIAPILGQIFAENIAPVDFDFIISVPLHKKRLKERGFNQSYLLALPLSEKFKKPILDRVLIRQKNTIPQFKVKCRERKANVADAFKIIDASKINGKIILLVDDIYTTGATSCECSKTLYEAGAKHVIITTLAKA